jgi:hypothetical protein
MSDKILDVEFKGKKFTLKSLVSNPSKWVDEVDCVFVVHNLHGVFTDDTWESPKLMVRGKKNGFAYNYDEVVFKM